MLDRVRTGPALGQTQLKMITHAHKQNIVGLSRQGQYLLEGVPLVRPETTTDAMLVEVTATAPHLTVLTTVSLRQAGVDVAAAVAKDIVSGTNVSLVIRQDCLALHRVATREQIGVCDVFTVKLVLFKVPIERLV